MLRPWPQPTAVWPRYCRNSINGRLPRSSPRNPGITITLRGRWVSGSLRSSGVAIFRNIASVSARGASLKASSKLGGFTLKQHAWAWAWVWCWWPFLIWLPLLSQWNLLRLTIHQNCLASTVDRSLDLASSRGNWLR